MKASFRDYVNTLRKNDELLEIAKPVDLRNVAALVAQSEKALLFKNVTGYSMPVVSGLLQSRNRIALGMGVAYENIADKLGKAMDKPIEPERVANAPVKEVIIRRRSQSLRFAGAGVFGDGRRSDDHRRRRHRRRPGVRYQRRYLSADAERTKHHGHRHRYAQQHAPLRRARPGEEKTAADFDIDRHPPL